MTDTSPDLSCTIGTIEVWLKAFIPRDVPDQTKPLPGSPSKTLLEVRGVPGYFATDQRSYSGDLDASARMTSLVVIDVKRDTRDPQDQRHWCDPTHKVDGRTGEVLKSKAGTRRATARTSRSRVRRGCARGAASGSGTTRGSSPQRRGRAAS